MINSLYNIKINPLKSKGSRVFDENTNRSYLDFMSMYSSLALGYNHEIFSSAGFLESVKNWAGIRITNCEHTCEEREVFEKKFTEFSSLGIFKNPHFSCTGALAIENAIKVSMDITRKKNPKIVSHINSFHGITSYGNLLTGRTGATKRRLDNFPLGQIWPKFDTIDDLKSILYTDESISGILIEPVQSTSGDLYFDRDFFREVRELANKYSIPLIFDEIQTGFCTSGKLWYFEHTGIHPDILVFGKKSQIPGFMIHDKITTDIDPSRYCVTWDGDIIDMIRSTYTIKAIEENNLIENASIKGNLISSHLKKMGLNVRSCGLLIAFDLENKYERDLIIKEGKRNGILLNPTGERSIRIRPNLAVTDTEINEFITRMSESINTK